MARRAILALLLTLPLPAAAEGAPPRDMITPEGCVLMRATLGADVIWAEVLGPDRQPWCPAPMIVAPVAPAATPRRPAVVPPQVQARAGDRFVQVGTFAAPENATRAAAQLRAQGWPVAFSDITVNGVPMRGVAAGPFAGQSQVQAALETARRIGFPGAIPQ